MTKTRFIALLLVGFFAGIAGAWVAPGLIPKSTLPVLPAGEAAPAKETAYDRVMRTNELRCGYGIFAPYFTKDAATGAFGGIWYDFAEAIGKQLGVKIVWAEEVGLGEVNTALNGGKIDAFCSGLWTAGKRMRVVDYTNPSAYEPMLVYVRIDDHRFDNDLTLINDPNVGVSTMDGEGGGLVAAEEFPKAKMVSLPQLSNYADMFNQVVTKKADVVLAAPSGAAAFLKNNPGVLRGITSKPVRVFPVALALKYGDSELRDLLNTAQSNIINDGDMEKILAKGEVNKGDFWRVNAPYQMPQQ